MELISIIIPVYNSEKHLKKCLDSIINQNYKNIEIIIIDDGSVDNSYIICDNYKKKDKRIKIIKTKNNGVSTARNIGIQNANGIYLTFIDSDDYIDSDYIDILYKTISKYNVNCVVSSLTIKNNTYFVEEMNSNNAIINMMKSKKIDSSACGKMIRTDIAKDIMFDTKLIIAEDMKFYYDLFKSSKNIFYMDYCGYHYIKYDNSAINSISSKKVENLNLFENMLKSEKNRKINDAILSKYLSTTFHFFLLSKNEEVNNTLRNIIKKYRLKAIFKNNIVFKVKIACILSIVDFNILKKIYKK